jgi:hypothetical protein
MVTIYIETIHIDTIHMTGPPAPALVWHVGPMQPKGDPMPIEVSLTTEEKVRLAITPMTPGGQPAEVDGDARWTVAGDCTAEPIDATSAWILAGATLGDSTVTVACDADLGAGVVPLGDTCLVHVSNPQAAQLGLEAGTPELKTSPTP